MTTFNILKLLEKHLQLPEEMLVEIQSQLIDRVNDTDDAPDMKTHIDSMINEIVAEPDEKARLFKIFILGRFIQKIADETDHCAPSERSVA